jgi:hypothetical protein
MKMSPVWKKKLRQTLICSLIMLVLVVFSPFLFSIGKRIVHGSAIEAGGVLFTLPWPWITESEESTPQVSSYGTHAALLPTTMLGSTYTRSWVRFKKPDERVNGPEELESWRRRSLERYRDVRFAWRKPTSIDSKVFETPTDIACIEVIELGAREISCLFSGLPLVVEYSGSISDKWAESRFYSMITSSRVPSPAPPPGAGEVAPAKPGAGEGRVHFQ